MLRKRALGVCFVLWVGLGVLVTSHAVGSQLLGDLDENGIVDGEDLNLALFGWDQDGATLPSEWVHMRPADGVAVGVEELNKVLFTWAETFPSTASVPEPATIALGAISLLMLVASQTRRRRT